MINSNFPSILFRLIEGEKYPHAIGWGPNGTMWVNTKTFHREVMKVHFRGVSKFASFTRKMNRYGFKRIIEKDSLPSDIFVYHHDKFRCGTSLDVVNTIRIRKKSLRSGVDNEERVAGHEAKIAREIPRIHHPTSPSRTGTVIDSTLLDRFLPIDGAVPPFHGRNTCDPLAASPFQPQLLAAGVNSVYTSMSTILPHQDVMCLKGALGAFVNASGRDLWRTGNSGLAYGVCGSFDGSLSNMQSALNVIKLLRGFAPRY